MKASETLPECIAREVWEETGLKVTVHDLLAVSEYLDSSQSEHKVECFFAAELTEIPSNVHDWQDIAGPVRSFGFFSDAEISAMHVLPAFVKRLSAEPLGKVYIEPN